MMRLIALLFGASVWLCATVQAQTPADEAIARGVQLRRQGRNAEALAEFQRAYAAAPSARAQAQIALAEQALGHWLAAESGLSRALEQRSDAWIAKNEPALQEALATTRTHLASLRIETDAEGASLFAGGEPLGTSPLAAAVRVPAGELYVEARLAGRSRGQQLSLPAGSEQRVRLELGPDPNAPESVPPPAVAQPLPAPASPAPAAVAPPDWSSLRASSLDSAPGGAGMRTGGVAALVAGGLLLGGAVAAHVVREYHASKLSDLDYCSPRYDCTRHYDTAKTAQTLAIIGYASAGAAIVGGVLLLWLAPDAGPHGAARLVPDLGPGGAGLQLTAAF